MHNDEMTPPPLAPQDRTPSAPTPGPVVRRLPAELDNWQVWDIDAAPPPAAVHGDGAGAVSAPHIPDRLDDALIVTLPERRWQVVPGNAVALPVTVLNNSTRRLTVRAHLEGWLDDRWVTEPYVQTALAPGERRTLELTVAPPRQAQAEAGDYQLAVVVRALEAFERVARAGLVLTLLPFDRVQLDLAADGAPPATWWRRTLTLPLHITNDGNHPLTLRLNGTTPAPLGRIVLPGGDAADTAEIALTPGQRTRVPVRLTVTRLPLAALHNRTLPFALTARNTSGQVLQQLRSSIEVRPVIGAWQMASFAGLAVAGVAAVSLLLLVGALFLRANTADSQTAAPVPPPAPAVIVVTLNQPVAAAPNGATPSFATALQSQPDPALPLVLPDQVTAPGSGGPARSVAPLAEVAPVAPDNGVAAGAPLTYAQMFQSVGAQYDLDWRMLAAQAYIESSFDALALSSAGAMGLMQVLPSTWREWAPAVGASDPFDSYSNVQVAAVYLDYLRTQLAQQGHPEKEWMLVAYNWGLDRVNDFLASGGAWQELPDARRKYAEDILRIAQTLP
jgi:membrane-bound lytic murein transglycosylase F